MIFLFECVIIFWMSFVLGFAVGFTVSYLIDCGVDWRNKMVDLKPK